MRVIGWNQSNNEVTERTVGINRVGGSFMNAGGHFVGELRLGMALQNAHMQFLLLGISHTKQDLRVWDHQPPMLMKI